MLAAKLASVGVTRVPVSLDLAEKELESTKEKSMAGKANFKEIERDTHNPVILIAAWIPCEPICPANV